MNGKSFVFAILGVLAAGILCVLVGVIVYFTTDTSSAALIAVIAMFVGGMMSVFPLIILLCIGISALVRKIKKK